MRPFLVKLLAIVDRQASTDRQDSWKALREILDLVETNRDMVAEYSHDLANIEGGVLLTLGVLTDDLEEMAESCSLSIHAVRERIGELAKLASERHDQIGDAVEKLRTLVEGAEEPASKVHPSLSIEEAWDRAFANHQYGREETANARHWFEEGWISGNRVSTVPANDLKKVESRWRHHSTVTGGRMLYIDQEGRELLQRPSMEWTIRPTDVLTRLELGTNDLDEAIRRADWSSEQWNLYRKSRAAMAVAPVVESNCKACRYSFMEPDDDLTCGHKDADTVGTYVRVAASSNGHCGPQRPKFEQHPHRNPDGSLKKSEPTLTPTDPSQWSTPIPTTYEEATSVIEKVMNSAPEPDSEREPFEMTYVSADRPEHQGPFLHRLVVTGNVVRDTVGRAVEQKNELMETVSSPLLVDLRGVGRFSTVGEDCIWSLVRAASERGQGRVAVLIDPTKSARFFGLKTRLGIYGHPVFADEGNAHHWVCGIWKGPEYPAREMSSGDEHPVWSHWFVVQVTHSEAHPDLVSYRWRRIDGVWGRWMGYFVGRHNKPVQGGHRSEVGPDLDLFCIDRDQPLWKDGRPDDETLGQIRSKITMFVSEQ